MILTKFYVTFHPVGKPVLLSHKVMLIELNVTRASKTLGMDWCQWKFRPLEQRRRIWLENHVGLQFWFYSNVSAKESVSKCVMNNRDKHTILCVTKFYCATFSLTKIWNFGGFTILSCLFMAMEKVVVFPVTVLWCKCFPMLHRFSWDCTINMPLC